MYTGLCRGGPWDGREFSYDETHCLPYIDGWLESPDEKIDVQDLPPVTADRLRTSGEYRWDGVRWVWHLHSEKE